MAKVILAADKSKEFLDDLELQTLISADMVEYDLKTTQDTDNVGVIAQKVNPSCVVINADHIPNNFQWNSNVPIAAYARTDEGAHRASQFGLPCFRFSGKSKEILSFLKQSDNANAGQSQAQPMQQQSQQMQNGFNSGNMFSSGMNTAAGMNMNQNSPQTMNQQAASPQMMNQQMMNQQMSDTQRTQNEFQNAFNQNQMNNGSMFQMQQTPAETAQNTQQTQDANDLGKTAFNNIFANQNYSRPENSVQQTQQDSFQGLFGQNGAFNPPEEKQESQQTQYQQTAPAQQNTQQNTQQNFNFGSNQAFNQASQPQKQESTNTMDNSFNNQNLFNMQNFNQMPYQNMQQNTQQGMQHGMQQNTQQSSQNSSVSQNTGIINDPMLMMQMQEMVRQYMGQGTNQNGQNQNNGSGSQYDQMNQNSQNSQNSYSQNSGYNQYQNQNTNQGYSGMTPQQMLDRDLGNTKAPAKVVTIYSAKGGVGKTTIACELSTYLSLTSHGRGKMSVCLVDYNIDFGDVVNTLQFNPSGTNMVYWAADIQSRLQQGIAPENVRYSQDQIRAYLQKNEDDGLYALIAPLTNEDSMQLKEDQLEIMLDNIIKYGGFDFVVCDTGNNTRDSSVIALEKADIVYLMLKQDVNTANCNSSFLSTMNKIGFNMNKIRIVINKVRPRKSVAVSTDELREAFINPLTGKVYPCVVEIRDNSDVRKANNAGEPLVYQSAHEFSKSIGVLANDAIGENFALEEPKKKKGGLFGFGKKEKKEKKKRR